MAEYGFEPIPPWLPKPVDFYCAVVFTVIRLILLCVVFIESFRTSQCCHPRHSPVNPLAFKASCKLPCASHLSSANFCPLCVIHFITFVMAFVYLESSSFPWQHVCSILLSTLSRKPSLSWPWVSSLAWECFHVTDLILEKFCLTDKLKIITLG